MKIRAREDESLSARVVARTPLLYREGADPKLDRPAHVRAGSALVRLPRGALAIVQDDASFLAIVDPDTQEVASIAFPSPDGVRQFDDQRGNKKEKLDLEAAVVVDRRLFAFGSGSSPRRERVVIVEEGKPPAIVAAPELYERMRSDRAFSGSELNVEGAALAGDDVLFFQRGNGRGDAVDATARVAVRSLLRYLDGEGPVPALESVVPWDLGSLGGVRLTFTDGTTLADGRIAFLACAEDSPDATRDGPVLGVAIGSIDDRARSAALGRVLDEDGALLVDKAEGLAFDAADPARAFVVIDKDDARIPSELLELRLGAAWHRGR